MHTISATSVCNLAFWIHIWVYVHFLKLRKIYSCAFLFSVITTVVVIMIPVLTIVSLLHMVTISITCSCGYHISVFALLSPFTSEGCESAELLLVTVVMSDFYESLIKSIWYTSWNKQVAREGGTWSSVHELFSCMLLTEFIISN